MRKDGQATLREGLAILGKALKLEPAVFTLAIVGSAAYSVMIVVSSEVIGWITNDVVVTAFEEGKIATGTLMIAVLAVVGVALIRAFGVATRRYFSGFGQYRLNARYRRKVSQQYLRLPLSWHQRHPTGRLLSNANADVEAAWWPVAPLPFALGTVVMLIVSLVSMFLVEPRLGLVGFLVFPSVMVINVLYRRRMSPLVTRVQALRASLSEVAHESFDGATVVKTLGREEEETRRFVKVARELRNALVATDRLRGVFEPLIDALPQLGILAVLMIGATDVANGSLDVGAVVQVSYLLTIAAFPLRAIGWLLAELPRSVVGWRRVSSVLDATGAMRYGATSVTEEQVQLRMRHVSYSYASHTADASTDVIRDVSFDIQPGRTVAIVGPTGSGKSTLAQLMVRLIDPDSGEVTLNNTDLREFRPGEIASTVALVLQDTFIFSDSVRGNVSLDRDISDASVAKALRLARASEFVSAIGGLEAQLGERGTTLSGGQRQRLALARALAGNPKLLILDDATSAVDPEVERQILRGLREVAQGTTVVMIAHRRATIALADEVMYVDNGQLIDHGTHRELMARVPAYVDVITAYDRDGESPDPGEHP